MQSVIIITYSDYPNGSAGAIRYATFAETYSDMGYEVIVFSKTKCDNNSRNQIETFDSGNRYVRLLLYPFRILGRLKYFKSQKDISGVILGSDILALHAYIIQKWCRSNGINCIFDATEWYSKEQFKNWFTSFFYWDKHILNKYVLDKKSRVIAISSFLYDYFKRKGSVVVKIPIFYNKKVSINLPYKRSVFNGSIKIIYAGTHMLMDNIPMIIKAISLLPISIRSKIQFYIYGLTEAQLKEYISEDILEKVNKSLVIKGRRPNCEVIGSYQSADFSILLRDPSLRVNKAGFPSKVVESMRLGVPVICNYSSDLQSYIISGFNGVVVEYLDEFCVSNHLRKLLLLTKEEKLRMSENAVHTIESKLSSNLFESELNAILNL